MDFDENFLLALGLDPEENYAYPARPDMAVRKAAKPRYPTSK